MGVGAGVATMVGGFCLRMAKGRRASHSTTNTANKAFLMRTLSCVLGAIRPQERRANGRISAYVETSNSPPDYRHIIVRMCAGPLQCTGPLHRGRTNE